MNPYRDDLHFEIDLLPLEVPFVAAVRDLKVTAILQHHLSMSLRCFVANGSRRAISLVQIAGLCF